MTRLLPRFPIRRGGFTAFSFTRRWRHTPKGNTLLENFVRETEIARDWTPENILETMVEAVRDEVGAERVLLGISGGVDSSTLGLLLNQAIGDRLSAVFVDHGLLRLGEAQEVETALRDLGVNLTVVEASERFLNALEGVSDPEEKRKNHRARIH